MKNVVVTAYVSFKNPANYNYLNNGLRSQLARYGYRVRQFRLGDYSRTMRRDSFFSSIYQDYSTFATLFLSVPDNASVINVKNNFISVLRAYGRVVSSYGQLGNSIPSDQGEDNSQVTVDENNVEVIEEIDEPSSEIPGGGILLVGLGALAVYLISRN